jgi:hypothetical protein
MGRRMCEPPGEGDDTLNTAKGVLDWKEQRRARVKLPTVYSKEKWAERRLGFEELGHAMDIPGDKIEKMCPRVLDQVLEGRAPGKLLSLITGSLQVTMENDKCKEPERERKRKGESCVGKGKHGKSGEQNTAVGLLKEMKGKRSLGCEGTGSRVVKKRKLSIETSEAPTINASRERCPTVETVSEEDGEDKGGTTVTDKAVKADNAEVPKHLWRDRVFAAKSLEHLATKEVDTKEELLDKVRAALLVYWKRKVERDFVEWFHSTEHRTISAKISGC